MTSGIFVLLAKKGDPLLIGNKRGLTLLNCVLKLLTKLFQLRLSGVLQDFISEPQQASLPGRSIHRAVMLANEALRKAKMTKRDFLLLKLDTIKMLDYLNWTFLLKLLEALGFGQEFLKVIVAIHRSATAAILIQGRLSEPFEVKRSVRQGCPMSPLLYIIVAHALGVLITKETDEGRIGGVMIEETGEQYTHAQFMDDTSMLIEAKRPIVDQVLLTFWIMGNASGLLIKETNIKAVFISPWPMLVEISALNWQWKNESNFSKLLGFHIGPGISAQMSAQHL